MTHNLLVIDWDYFFPNPMDGGEYKDHAHPLLYDWGHRETDLHINGIWTSRALGFRIAGVPLPQVNDEWHDLWARFDVAPETTLYVADSNAYAAAYVGTLTADRHPEDPWRSVWLYDAHHDCGYDQQAVDEYRHRGMITCEMWMMVHADQGSDLHVRYPRWKVYADAEPEPLVEVDRQVDDGTRPPVTFDGVFLCRSGAWVPPWCDESFAALMSEYPYGEVCQLDDADLRRDFSVQVIDAQATLIRDEFGARS